jgi:subtilase family serine protease
MEMRMSLKSLFSRLLITAAILSLTISTQAQVKARISRPLESDAISTMHGNVHPQARAEFDRGAVDDAMPMHRVMLFFQQTAAQQKALELLLEQQLDPASSNYHQWLTPEQFADRFGMAQADMDKVTAWLKAQGLTIDEVARSRNSVAFSGSASKVALALHTQIHNLMVDGESHFANLSDPSLPAGLAAVVSGIRGLDDFRPKARPGLVRHINPNFTSNISGRHFLAPDDLATIYNISPLYSAGTDGTGQSIAIVGQTDIQISDVQKYRSVSGLTAKDPTVILVPGSPDPGISSGDIVEANLDLDVAGAVARNATIIFVNSGNGAFDSLIYAVNNNVAPVISSSYGSCERNFSPGNITVFTQLGQQANAQGQTVLSASGDSGAADCEAASAKSAVKGLAIDLPAGLPTVTGVGGTLLDDQSGTFFGPVNTANQASALSYIPEKAWNDTTEELAANPQGSIASAGGGKSTNYAKPAYQTGTGVPNDGQRDVPDISLASSADHVGYLICNQGSCVTGFRDANQNLTIVGGTSAATPALAGVVALINQKKGGRQGNINPTLYAMAITVPNAFHDITVGDNKVPCTADPMNPTFCPSSPIGFSAGTGYDQVTGLGSIDANILVTQWTTAGSGAGSADFIVTASKPSLTTTRGTAVTATVNVAGTNNFNGTVTFTCAAANTLTGVSCSVSPNSVNGGGAATLTVTPPAQGAFVTPHNQPFAPQAYWASFTFAFGFLAIPAAALGRGRRKKLLFGLVLMVAFTLVSMGCGGGGGSTTTPAPTPVVTGPLNGNVTVTATSGALAHTAVVAVTVN